MSTDNPGRIGTIAAVIAAAAAVALFLVAYFTYIDNHPAYVFDEPQCTDDGIAFSIRQVGGRSSSLDAVSAELAAFSTDGHRREVYQGPLPVTTEATDHYIATLNGELICPDNSCNDETCCTGSLSYDNGRKWPRRVSGVEIVTADCTLGGG